MSFIERELARLGAAIVDPINAERRDQLYAAQQALGWAIEPTGIKTPYNMIMGTPEEPGDYPGEPRPPSSSDTCAQGG
jgi:hypothetical protein